MSSQHSTNDNHHSRHPDTATNQSLLSSNEINTNQQENQSHDDLDGTINPGSEQRRVGRTDTDSLKDLRSIVADTIGTGELLPEHEAESEEEAISVALANGFFPCHALGGSQFFFERGANLGEFFQDLLTVLRLVANVG